MAAFVDTNILLYAYSSVNEGETEKVEVAKRLIDRLTENDTLILSAQVLSEFVWIGGKKGKKPLTTVELALIVNDLSKQTVVTVDASLIQLALKRTQQSRISYWDALIVEAAIRSGATTLYTEDMHHGTRYGGLQLLNPFIS
jgi:predicted nucleic acid-binding protein